MRDKLISVFSIQIMTMKPKGDFYSFPPGMGRKKDLSPLWMGGCSLPTKKERFSLAFFMVTWRLLSISV
ncbi:hypothetical protein BW425_12320 [Bacillus pseudomycoides]|uniref:Uncharacterized protein n=2 Tax=Bacillus pseudomycoides TaxID=64104 RepID=A0A1Y3MF66_9BACI|nr:hypothetical protein BW425_12320 [Bacillus pseudomycoides]PEK70627.1 hypothetical protein CN590_07980 [Bacillus pseudomycoides]PEL33466.1 hypothetical protein CN608_02310 [Bacillus pseudomycoides]